MIKLKDLIKEEECHCGDSCCSTKEQVKETVEKHFKEQNDLILIAFDTNDLINNLKWEPARNGDLFPHYYGIINTTSAKKIYSLELGADNIHKFPENFFS